ncbi:hypothetical protein AJ79_05664 [Helicocarpus griseus UAMH5409]|uniref:Pirin N-terminal domain-containing protein n=1 Tax=Helicocarpus griseus UAMH5409 TaxID=1447875 RepID=A0A2B7XLY4_9EURO|nr:hypothetical protein AJ79_05664 [Helicocarpus griseus UAMH5409]
MGETTKTDTPDSEEEHEAGDNESDDSRYRSDTAMDDKDASVDLLAAGLGNMNVGDDGISPSRTPAVVPRDGKPGSQATDPNLLISFPPQRVPHVNILACEIGHRRTRSCEPEISEQENTDGNDHSHLSPPSLAKERVRRSSDPFGSSNCRGFESSPPSQRPTKISILSTPRGSKHIGITVYDKQWQGSSEKKSNPQRLQVQLGGLDSSILDSPTRVVNRRPFRETQDGDTTNGSGRDGHDHRGGGSASSALENGEVPVRKDKTHPTVTYAPEERIYQWVESDDVHDSSFNLQVDSPSGESTCQSIELSEITIGQGIEERSQSCEPRLSSTENKKQEDGHSKAPVPLFPERQGGQKRNTNQPLSDKEKFTEERVGEEILQAKRREERARSCIPFDVKSFDMEVQLMKLAGQLLSANAKSGNIYICKATPISQASGLPVKFEGAIVKIGSSSNVFGRIAKQNYYCKNLRLDYIQSFPYAQGKGVLSQVHSNVHWKINQVERVEKLIHTHLRDKAYLAICGCGKEGKTEHKELFKVQTGKDLELIFSSINFFVEWAIVLFYTFDDIKNLTYIHISLFNLSSFLKQNTTTIQPVNTENIPLTPPPITLPPLSAMSIPRAIRQAFMAIEQAEGAGARVRRSIGTAKLRNFSPFLMLDHFTIGKGAGFPDHPHRGQETITYLLSGGVDHEDFAGNKGTIGPGDLQFMTAGRGIMHAEMPHENPDGSPNVGMQLWVDLPEKLKMCEPRYRDLRATEIPVATVDDGKVTVKVISGQSHGVDSVRDLAYTPVWIFDITIRPGGKIAQTLPQGWNAFAYTLAGTTTFGAASDANTTPSSRLDDSSSAKTVGAFHNVVFDKAGDFVHASAAADAQEESRFMLVAGQPLDQKVVQYGPFVLSSQEQVYQAMLDYQSNANGFERARGWASEIGKRMGE